MPMDETRISVIGLGYVGLPIACAFDQAGFPVVGYDTDSTRVEELKNRKDRTGECDSAILGRTKIKFSDNPADLQGTNFLIVTVPTPIDKANRPDLTALKEASETVGRHLTRGSIVVFESTVYPGVTEEICVPILQRHSGLKCGADFRVGYCPERINPGDKEHTLEKVVKIVSASDEDALKKIVQCYSVICKAGIWKTPNIKTAEAAKVIENIQRDLNIALMNELSILFHKIGISTRDVLNAASTKWNFHRYTPGLVGGHCIGVDPYYLTHLAEIGGFYPELILAARRINDHMANYVVDQVLLGLVKNGKIVKRSKVLILGLTFKEDVPDIRNSKAAQIIAGLKMYGIEVHAGDPLVSEAIIRSKFQAVPAAWPLLANRYDAILLAVRHRQFVEKLPPRDIVERLEMPGMVVDLKWMYDRGSFPDSVLYETL